MDSIAMGTVLMSGAGAKKVPVKVPALGLSRPPPWRGSLEFLMKPVQLPLLHLM